MWAFPINSEGEKIIFIILIIAYFLPAVYESELAPEKELAPENFKHQHPQEAPVITEKHVLERSVKHKAVKEKKEQPSGPNKQFTKSASEKLEPTYAAVSEFASHKPAQSYTSVSDVTQTVNETAEATKDGSTTASAREVDTGNNAGNV